MSATLQEGIRRPITVPAGGASLQGIFTIPPDARGLVIFVHGSGHSRENPRNQGLAKSLNDASLATLLCDLLTDEEELIDELTGEFRFATDLLAQRLSAIIDWCTEQPELRGLHIGLFGAGTGAAAALVAATHKPELIGAIVARGGRPDLAWPYLPRVAAPTLFVVGERDQPIRAACATSLKLMKSARTELLIIPQAGHLFLEPGTGEQLGEHAVKWFEQHLELPEQRLRGWDTKRR